MAVRLVLADDHLVLRQALKQLLERRGLEVVADEADGRAAVDAVQRLSPDVAVLDVAMPVLNGVDAAREIARIAPACPVILLSGIDDTRFVREAPDQRLGHPVALSRVLLNLMRNALKFTDKGFVTDCCAPWVRTSRSKAGPDGANASSLRSSCSPTNSPRNTPPRRALESVPIGRRRR